MSKAVVYTGWKGGIYGVEGGDFRQEDTGVTDVTIADGVTEIKEHAFHGCKGLTNLRFLKGSAITTVGHEAFHRSGLITLQGMERVRKIGRWAFYNCQNLRTIEGLGCEEMGVGCFAGCTLLPSMKGWPASMTVIPARCFYGCTGMTTVDCDISHVTSIGEGAFYDCTSLLPPSLSAWDADPAAVLAFLKRKSILERVAERCAFLCSLKRAQGDFYNRTGDPCGASRRIIMEFAGLFPA
ncbi:hypothetical protein TeGR_g10036 [Tetraparma gracilis]|uniref:Leucine-rich repeat domain-containing protein n=1 Tax=Tetraparma gracilis TaxID=2962635 RepID=A0ABQ6MWZ9_9STRA|nr:hypothetical protein TeGR_g10036 [Tetraparma gracilis]